jgi:RHS repeat-associated protein
MRATPPTTTAVAAANWSMSGWPMATSTIPLTFTYLDSSTNLYKFGTRYDDPSLGRWTQQDPVGGSLGDLNSANRYAYANDDPVNAVDPSGELTCFQSILTAIATIVGTAQIGEYLAAAALAAFGGPLGFIAGLLIAAGAIYVEILAANQAFVDCGHPEYQFPLPF